MLGLGNPGPDYQETRHNAGFWVTDMLVRGFESGWKKPLFRSYRIAEGFCSGKSLFCVQPLTFMNRSGEILEEVFRRTGEDLDGLVVVADTLDLPAGGIRIKRAGSAGGQKGLASVIAHAGSDRFCRIFVGIGHPGNRDGVIDHVLGVPGAEERVLLDGAVGRAAAAVRALCTSPVEQVMNEYNRASL